MKLMAFLPPHLKDLLRHVPTLLFEVVEWADLSRELFTLSKRILASSEVVEVKNTLSAHLPTPIVFKTDESKTKLLPDQTRKLLSEAILELYFIQVLKPGPMFLDISQDRFHYANGKYNWTPSSLWSEFSPTFQLGVRDIYQGFYGENNKQFRSGLTQCGLISPKWDEGIIIEIETLFKSHFASGIDHEMKFNLSDFQVSFQKIFEFLMKHKVKLNADFMLLGIMLVTLYTHLESLDQKIAPSKCFNQALAQIP